MQFYVSQDPVGNRGHMGFSTPPICIYFLHSGLQGCALSLSLNNANLFTARLSLLTDPKLHSCTHAVEYSYRARIYRDEPGEIISNGKATW
jgi:hypothetical protein